MSHPENLLLASEAGRGQKLLVTALAVDGAALLHETHVCQRTAAVRTDELLLMPRFTHRHQERTPANTRDHYYTTHQTNSSRWQPLLVITQAVRYSRPCCIVNFTIQHGLEYLTAFIKRLPHNKKILKPKFMNWNATFFEASWLNAVLPLKNSSWQQQ